MKFIKTLLAVALMAGGLHLHAQNHDVEYNCFITAEMDARLDGNDAGSYGITQLDIIKGSNTFHLGGSLLAAQPLDRSFWAYTEHSITPKTDILFASYYDTSPLAPSKWYAGAGIHQQIGRTTLCMHYVWRQFYDDAPSNTLDMTMHTSIHKDQPSTHLAPSNARSFRTNSRFDPYAD